MYGKDIFIADVRRLLDEQGVDDSFMTNNGYSGTSATEADDDELDAIIWGYAVEARNFVLAGCDRSLLLQDCAETQATESSGVVSISGLLRLVSVKCSNWKREVSEFVDMGSPEYTMFKDPITAGTEWSPKVALGFVQGRTGTSEAKIEVSPAGIASVVYVPDVAVSGTGSTAALYVYSGQLQAAVRHYAAGLTCLSLGDEKRGENFIQIARGYMGSRPAAGDER